MQQNFHWRLLLPVLLCAITDAEAHTPSRSLRATVVTSLRSKHHTDVFEQEQGQGTLQASQLFSQTPGVVVQPVRTRPGQQLVPPPVSPAKKPRWHPSQWTAHDVATTTIYALFAAGVFWTGAIYMRERAAFRSTRSTGDSFFLTSDDGKNFDEYLEFKFFDWFTTNSHAPSVILIAMTLVLIVVGGASYAFLTGESHADALFRVFIWGAGAETSGEKSISGRFMGVFVTAAGLVILSVLLGIVADAFSTRMEIIRQGLTRVVDGGHTVILGYNDGMRVLLQELAAANETEGGTVFAILTHRPKMELEEELSGHSGLNLRNSRIIVRSGDSCLSRDLLKVNVSAASRVVLLANTTFAPEASDAQTMRRILALRLKGWPTEGQIVVQCQVDGNRSLLTSLGEGKTEVVVVADIIAKLMVESAKQPGLSHVFESVLGYDDSEFYNKCHPEFEGKSFEEVFFRLPDAIALGVFHPSGECSLNPPMDYVIAKDDRIIVLADDDDTYKPSEKPYFDVEAYNKNPRVGLSPREKSDLSRPATRKKKQKILLIGWNGKGEFVLDALNEDDSIARGSKIISYSSRPEDCRKSELADKRGDYKFTMEYKTVAADVETSRLEIQALCHQECDRIFVLADVDSFGSAGADERSIAILAQFQSIEDETPCPVVEPAVWKSFRTSTVVEICEDATQELLPLLGVTTFLHSNSLVSQALAGVCYDREVNRIYEALMSVGSSVFDIQPLDAFMPPLTELPPTLTFGEAAVHVMSSARSVLVGWSEGSADNRRWIMNPPDKVNERPWAADDRLVLIRKAPNFLEDLPPSATSSIGPSPSAKPRRTPRQNTM